MIRVWEDPFEGMRRFRREMNRLFDSFFGDDFDSRATPGMDNNRGKDVELFRQPLSDLRETDKELIASIEIPGVDKKDIQLRVTEDRLEVKVEKRQEMRIEKEGYLKAERSYRGFHRLIPLPSRIVPERSRASYKDGVLEVIMPKSEKREAEKAKKIEVQ